MHEAPIRLRAFVGRSFLESDKQVWHDLRDLLDTLRPIGFVYEDAKEAQARPVSEKVRELVLRNDIYIGVLTRRYLIADEKTFLQRCGTLITPAAPKRWTASEWVVEEVGYALGKDKRVILLIEEGVVFPTTDLDADTEWIPFRRENMTVSQSSLTSMINNLIGKGIPAPAVASATTDAPPAQMTDKSPESVKSFPEQLEALRQAASSGETAEADRIQNELVESEEDSETKKFMTTFLLADRARRGDGVALARLKTQLDQSPGDLDTLIWLANVYASFGEHEKAEELFAHSASHIDPSRKSAFAAEQATTLRRGGKLEKAIRLLRERMPNQSSDEDRLKIWDALARVAEDLEDTDLEASFLEKLVELEPTNHDRRFRLAWLYGHAHREKAAAYHYDLVVRKAGWEGARNNLAVAYGELELKATQVEHLLLVMDKHDLSKANIAALYEDAGFLTTAESYAKSVLQGTDDEIANARARYVLDEIAATRTKEKEVMSKIDEETRAERQFMSQYADGYCASSVAPFEALYGLPNAAVLIKVSGTAISGSGSDTREWSGGLIALAMMRQTGSGPYFRRYVTKLKGIITGRAGTFELTNEIFNPPENTKPDSSKTTKGLFVIEPDLQTIKFLERDEKRTDIVVATREDVKQG